MVCSKHFKTTASMSQELKRVLTRVGKNENLFQKNYKIIYVKLMSFVLDQGLLFTAWNMVLFIAASFNIMVSNE